MSTLRKPKKRMYQIDLNNELTPLVGKQINSGVPGWNWIEELEEVEEWFEKL